MPLIDLTNENFDQEIDRHQIILLDFWAEWCEPCKSFTPIYEAASAEHPDILFARIDVDQQKVLAEQFEVKSIPTLLGVKDGTIAEVRLGTLTPTALDALIAKLRT